MPHTKNQAWVVELDAYLRDTKNREHTDIKDEQYWPFREQYNTRPLVLQYNTNTDAILTKSRFDPEKLKDLIIIKNQNSLVWKHLVYET